MSSNLPTILDALADALEAVTPDERPLVLFKRWRGGGNVEAIEAADQRVRAFQFRLGASRKPRTVSTLTATWHRCDLLVVVGYDFSADLYGDDANGLGAHWLAFVDQKKIVQTLGFGNPLSGVSNVKRLVFTGASAPGPTSRTYTFDLEWREG
jgi:hypothetical protein